MTIPEDLLAQVRAFHAVEHALDAASALTRAGEARRAAAALASAIEMLGALPPSNVRTYLDARALLERARLKWLGAGLEPSFSLEEAFVDALEAEDMLAEEIGPDLRTDVAATIAGIAYDLGDVPALAMAESELDLTIRALLDSGATAQAAQLMNELAAVQLRFGHHLRAGELLIRARELLESRLAASELDVGARATLADTRHLLARLALHAEALPDDAIQAAIDHAVAAETTYKRLGLRRDLARVWETIARLDAKRGRTASARAGFVAAITVADDTLDLVGLARSTEGLAGVLAESDPMRALDMLASSIELNREKGSKAGLEFDEHVLAGIDRAVTEGEDASPELLAELARTKKRLEDAKRATIPRRADGP